MKASTLLPYMWYPCILAGAVLIFCALLSRGATPIVAAYLPTIIVGVVIVILETYFPERLEWRPRRQDIMADAAFMIAVQVALPRFLAAAVVFTAAAWAHANQPSSWWPHSWPLGVQLLLMVLLVDLMRYWLHRACHRIAPLWRLHEVHHSPDILYVLNVGRFHPFEKTLHFALDTVPFVLLGLAPGVIAGYFLLYSVNGFFQHSNVRLRYGWLNYIVASAETHRWHHARDPKTAACNFSNTTILWDLAFGTYHLPKKTGVEEIGIVDRDYPKGFLAQMVTPFMRH